MCARAAAGIVGPVSEGEGEGDGVVVGLGEALDDEVLGVGETTGSSAPLHPASSATPVTPATTDHRATRPMPAFPATPMAAPAGSP